MGTENGEDILHLLKRRAAAHSDIITAGANTAGADTGGTNIAGADATATGDHLVGIEVKRPDGVMETGRLDCPAPPALRMGAASSGPLTHLDRPLTRCVDLWSAFSGNGKLKQSFDQDT